MRRFAAILAANLVALALLAPAALANSDHGEGWYGETNDKVVTNFGFALIAFFPLFIAVMSLIQWRLDKRKEDRKAAQKKLRAHFRVERHQHVQVIWVRVRQGPKEDRVSDAKNRGVCTDGEREGHDGNDRECGRLCQPTKCEPEIFEHSAEY